MYWLAIDCENVQVGETHDVLNEFADYYIEKSIIHNQHLIYAGYFARDFAFWFTPSCAITTDENNVVTSVLLTADS